MEPHTIDDLAAAAMSERHEDLPALTLTPAQVATIARRAA